MTEIESEFAEVRRGIIAVLESRLELIVHEMVKDAKRLILEREIRDKGDFYRNTDRHIAITDTDAILTIGSNVAHEPFVLGGKVPSWTPLEPIKAWVERKKLAWVDKKTKKEMTVEEIAQRIIYKIKAQGIPARNVFAEVVKNRQDWVLSQINTIGR